MEFCFCGIKKIALQKGPFRLKRQRQHDLFGSPPVSIICRNLIPPVVAVHTAKHRPAVIQPDNMGVLTNNVPVLVAIVGDFFVSQIHIQDGQNVQDDEQGHPKFELLRRWTFGARFGARAIHIVDLS